MSKIYLLTGAAGHLGRTVAEELLRQGKKLRVLLLPGEKNIPSGDFEICYGDVRSKASLRSLFSNPNNDDMTVIHAAGIVSIASKYSELVYDTNVMGTKNIVNLCEEHGVEHLIYVSSVHAIPVVEGGKTITEAAEFDPLKTHGLYARTKAEATNAVLEAGRRGLRVNVVHPSGLIGPNDFGRGHMTAMVIDYMRGRLTAIIKGGYDFADVRDVAAGILSCCEKGRPGECYILSNRFVPVRELVEMLHEITGRKMIRRVLPLWFVRLTAPLAELYYKMRKSPPLYTPYSIEVLTSNANFSHEKATRELGYKARDVESSLRDTIDWLTANGRI